MADLLDLVAGQDEARCTSYLALLMSLDPSRTLVRRFMKLARDTWETRREVREIQGAHHPLKNWPIDASLENLQITTEESFKASGDPGRFDLVLRFRTDDLAYMMVVEVKVQAHGEHGDQLARYREEMTRLEQAAEPPSRPQTALVLLTVHGADQANWSTPLSSIPHLAGDLRWNEVLALATTGAKETGIPADATYSTILQSLQERISELGMSTQDYAPLLQANASPSYPLLVDALEALAREASGGAKLYRKPISGREGATWDGEENAYWCQYWWSRANGSWAGLIMEWKWKDALDHSAQGAIPSGGGGGYRFALVLETPKGEEVLCESEADFASQLSSLTHRIKKMLDSHPVVQE